MCKVSQQNCGGDFFEQKSCLHQYSQIRPNRKMSFQNHEKRQSAINIAPTLRRI